MNVYWLEQTESKLPAENAWLSPAEQVKLSGMHFAKRRHDWRLGRWTAKHAVAACFELPTDSSGLAEIEVRATPSGAPEVVLSGKRIPVCISISHRAGIAICAIGLSSTSFGCDLETIEPRSDAFVADYFTQNEQSLVGSARAEERSRLVALLWSAKESALKALRVGLQLDTRCMDVALADAPPLIEDCHNLNTDMRVLPSDGWRPLQILYADSQVFRGCWRSEQDMVRTIVSAQPLVPVELVHIPQTAA